MATNINFKPSQGPISLRPTSSLFCRRLRILLARMTDNGEDLGPGPQETIILRSDRS